MAGIRPLAAEPMTEMNSLVSLDMSDNTMYNFSILTSQPMLETIILDLNIFSELNFSNFPVMPKLKTLSMRNCQIKSIASNYGIWDLKLKRLTKLNLR